MKKTIKKEIQGKLLTEEQASTVKQMIVASMRGSYTSVGTIPGDGFDQAAYQIASKVVDDVQKALVQSNVFEKVIKNSKPLQVKKLKKHVRK